MTEPPTAAEPPRFVSVRIKLIAAMAAIYALALVGVFYWFFMVQTRAAHRQIEQDLLPTLRGGLAGIDGDEFSALAGDAATGRALTADERYRRHCDWLRTIQSIEPRARPYSYVVVGDEARLVLVCRAGPGAPGAFRAWPAETVDLTPVSDSTGTWVAAYGPIRDSSGSAVGGLAIEFRADALAQAQAEARASLLVVLPITFSVLFVLAAGLARLFTRPLMQLARVVGEIGDGDYDHNLAPYLRPRFPDEIWQLAQTLDTTIHKLRWRYAALERQAGSRDDEVGKALDSRG